MGWLTRVWLSEPVLVIDFLKTAVLLAATFGLELTNEQSAALFAMLLAFSALTRSRVSPNPAAEDEESNSHVHRP